MDAEDGSLKSISLTGFPDVKHRVSSVLNKDTKQFGKQFIFDGHDHTCWNSDQGRPQWIAIEFPRVVQLNEILVQFQGGFVGKDCVLESKLANGESYAEIQEIYPADTNSCQISF